MRSEAATLVPNRFAPVGGRPEFDCLEDAVAAGIPLPCQDADPELFFAERPSDVERAKAICVSCPIRELCLDTALRRQEPWGVWGGEWFTAGQIATKRPRGRPRKNAA